MDVIIHVSKGPLGDNHWDKNTIAKGFQLLPPIYPRTYTLSVATQYQQNL